MVTFIDERKKMRIPQRVKPKHTEEPKQKKTTFKGAKDSSCVNCKIHTNSVHGVRHLNVHRCSSWLASCRHRQ